MNTIHIIGNLVADPQLKSVGESQVCEFGIAYNEVYYDHAKNKVEKVHFFNCNAWQKLGENIAKFFTKGQKIAVVGSLTQERWEKDGQKNSAVRIRVSGFDFCGDKKEGSGGQSSSTPPPKDPDLDAQGDDIPF